jgi:hypothetical protein
MAALRIRDRRELAARADLPYDGIRNTLNRNNPDPISLIRAWDIARVLAFPDETVEAVVDDILIDDADGTPNPPPDQPTQPVGPKRRTDTETPRKTGPKRAQSRSAT